MGEEQKKTSLQEWRDLAVRAQRKASELREHGEELAGEFLGTIGVSTGTFTAGVVDQWRGKDISDGKGIKQHAWGRVPSSLSVGVGLLGAAAFGVFGKHARVGYSLGQGGVGGYTNTIGRLVGQAILDKSAKNDEQTKDGKPAQQQAAANGAPQKTGTDG